MTPLIDLDALEQTPSCDIANETIAALVRAVRAAQAWYATEPESVRYPGPGDEAALIALEDALALFRKES